MLHALQIYICMYIVHTYVDIRDRSIDLIFYLASHHFSVFLFACIPIYLSVYPSNSSFYIYVCIISYKYLIFIFWQSIICLSIYISIYLFLYPSIFLFINISVYPSISLSIYLSIYLLFICLLSIVRMCP